MDEWVSYITGSSKDPSGLGRWSVCTLLIWSGHWLHIIFGYHPCQNSCSYLCSVYAQHNDILIQLFIISVQGLPSSWTWCRLLMIGLNRAMMFYWQQEITTFCCFLWSAGVYLILPPNFTLSGYIKHGNHHQCSPVDSIWATQGVSIQWAMMMCSIQHNPGDH